MRKRKNEFSEQDKVKALLWCARHCCLCGKRCGIGIEVAHVDPKSCAFEDAIPLCFNCHAAVGHYNREHPRGRKYSTQELTARRDQIYEKYTRHLVPPVRFGLKQKGRTLPDVGFDIHNLGNTYPVKARIRVTLAQGAKVLGSPDTGHYGGQYSWNLNPGFGVSGHFQVPPTVQLDSADPLRARLDVTLVDLYERSHALFSVGYILALNPIGEWYLEPSEEALAIPLGPDF
jgi:hypothetical protein